MEVASVPLIIRRYGTDRLYDGAGLRYLSRDTLRRWQAAGVPLVVIDAATGDDVTRAALD